MNLQEYDKIPDDFEKIAQAQYSVSQICAASKSQVSTTSTALLTRKSSGTLTELVRFFKGSLDIGQHV